MHEAAPLRQGNVAAVQCEAGEADMGCAFALKHRGAAGEDELGRAAHADQLRAVLQAELAGAVDAGRQRQRHLRARRLVDGALQVFGLVIRTAGPYAILRGVAAERGGEGSGARRLRRHRERARGTGGGSSNEMAAVDVHGRVFLADVSMDSITPELRPGMVNARLERGDCWG